MTESPIEKAADAKRRRDIGGEIGALIDGHSALTTAPWYPSRVGDRLLITYEATEQGDRWTETYEVADGDGGRALRPIGHTAPDDSLAGWFAGPPELLDGDPLETPWMEAGPDRLTVIRDGQIVHQGRHALAQPDDAPLRITTAAGPDGAIGWAVVQERQYTPAELDGLAQRIVARTQEMFRRGTEE
ncbi:hypothetical protein AB0F39_34475 [Streptomyces murinus]|uniref:hypothetical protein n=1 Tax=Streptomyces murinus TaxID=33900 RepID=UPI0033DA8CC3